MRTTPQQMSADSRLPGPNIVSEKLLYSFRGGTDAGNPDGPPIVINGELYGATYSGGTRCGGNGCGTVYAVDAAGRERVVYAFKGKGEDESAPAGSLIMVHGNLIGTTRRGGGPGCKKGETQGCGTVYELTTSGTEKILYRFPGRPGGAVPTAGLTLFHGSLYGSTAAGGITTCNYESITGCGLIFKMIGLRAPTIVYEFGGGSAGATPRGTLLDVNDKLYGVTSSGGGTACGGTFFGSACGTAFALTARGTHITLHQFGLTSDAGARPQSGLVMLDGNFYGTTPTGGPNKCYAMNYTSYTTCGTAFLMTPSGKLRTLYEFTGKLDGGHPVGLTVMNGRLYGTTSDKGYYDCGTVFSLTPGGRETTLYAFNHTGDGCSPSSLVSVGKTFYGTTWGGGAHGAGTIFRVTL
jgi:uncharacterized repeat protein (TIGR03803 family)